MTTIDRNELIEFMRTVKELQIVIEGEDGGMILDIEDHEPRLTKQADDFMYKLGQGAEIS